MGPIDLISRLNDLPNLETVLDLGCGDNSSPVSKQVLEIPAERLISVDTYGPTLQRLHGKETKATRHKIVKMLIPSYLAETTEQFDVVLMLDVLEHFRKDIAMGILECLEFLARRRILIWLPLGECPQGVLDKNPYQCHLSRWSAGELEELGFRVEVFPGFHTQFSPAVDAAWARKDFR